MYAKNTEEATAIIIDIMKNMTLDNLKWIDYHCHCLPAIDRDATSDTDEAAAMLLSLSQQGVKRIYATPHFYLHQESAQMFAARRNASYNKLRAHPVSSAFPPIVLSAEISIERGISEHDLSPILSETGIALLELPYFAFKQWIIEEIENILYKYSIIPLIAHIERYLWYEESKIEKLMSIENVFFQVNCGAFMSVESLKWIRKLVKSNAPIVFGSDSHNMTDRAPSFDVINQFVKDTKPFIKAKHKAKTLDLIYNMIERQFEMDEMEKQILKNKK